MRLGACFLAGMILTVGGVPVLARPQQVQQQPQPPAASRPDASRQGKRSPQAPQRLHLAPQFAAGTLLRYQMEFRTTTDSRRIGLVEDPEAPSQLEMTWNAVVRIEVLSVEADAAGKPGDRTKLRTTYEKSAATTHSDTFDPEAGALEAQYHKLEGRTVQFTLDAKGQVSEVKGLEDLVTDQQAAGAAREWLGELTMGAALPAEGIVPGQQWSSEKPATAVPIAGTLWRTDSTYLRDEPCRTTPVGGASAKSDPYASQTCAVILTRFSMTQPRPAHDPTPEEYRKSGLRTAGAWKGSGESLTYVSLKTGWVVSVTQTGDEVMDVTVSTADGESKVRYAGHVKSQSQVTLLPDASPTAP